MTMSTDADVLEYEPSITQYGIQTFTDLHEKTRQDIYRLLRIDWWARQKSVVDRYSVVKTPIEMDTTKIDDTQFTRCAVFHVLAYYILPRLSKFTPESDIFNEKMQFYKARFQEEFQLVLRDGVNYDFNDDGTVSDSEKQPVHFGRLVR